MTMKKAIAAFAMFGLFTGVSNFAQAQLVNGGFETTTSGPGQLGFNTDATGWSVPGGGYTFLFASGTADNTGANGQYGSLSLWGPNNGSANSLPASSPDGGNFIASDGAFQVQPLQQTLMGLTAGHTYSVSFDWAAAQQYGFNGDTQSGWTVSLGGDSQDTGAASIPNHGFSGWKNQTFNYVATSANEVLSFLAHGTPAGVPPFSLLDGVSVTDTSAVPEPTAVVSLFAGAIGFGAFARRRSRTAKSAA